MEIKVKPNPEITPDCTIYVNDYTQVTLAGLTCKHLAILYRLKPVSTMAIVRGFLNISLHQAQDVIQQIAKKY